MAQVSLSERSPLRATRLRQTLFPSGDDADAPPPATSEVEAVVHWQQNAALRQFLAVCAIGFGWIAIDLVMLLWDELHGRIVELSPFRLWTSYLLPAFAATSYITLNRLSRTGWSPLRGGPVLLGLVFIVGGALFDIGVTFHHSPDLALEGNLYVRALLDSRHSVDFVYAHMVLTQSLFVALFCSVWIAFLRHHGVIVETIRAARPNSWIDFLQAATGGAHLSRRQWLIPLQKHEVPLIYHSVWITAVAIVFGISLFRWYAGLEWLGVVQPDLWTRTAIVSTGICGALALYLANLYRHSRRVPGPQPLTAECATLP